ncbi:hypothetical protein GCWU000323_01886 [Leptotrichia hofstadii F0254]|uniref:Uncharacterized protein n=1 Tax=Leptotrichia hofstadii F0254 TaxID=634994 RepID=C9MZ89_9FUSO|nr:hypothetical protein GCWU000323_01886 [Leptotrichia hofstadii F0254]
MVLRNSDLNLMLDWEENKKMKFWNFLKRALMFTLKETYSFFLKTALFILLIFIIGISTIAIFDSKNKNERKKATNTYFLMLQMSTKIKSRETSSLKKTCPIWIFCRA